MLKEPLCDALIAGAAGYNAQGTTSSLIELCMKILEPEHIQKAFLVAAARVNLVFIGQLITLGRQSKNFPPSEQIIHYFGFREFDLAQVGLKMELKSHFPLRKCFVSALQLLIASIPKNLPFTFNQNEMQALSQLVELQVGMVDELGQPALTYAYCLGVPELIKMLKPTECSIVDVFNRTPLETFRYYVECKLQLGCMDVDGRIASELLADEND